MKRLSILVFISAMAVAVWAVPARRNGVVLTQPDGSQITVYQHGDEHFHWQTNEKGEWVKMAEDGYYRVTKALSSEQIAAKRMASPRRAQSAYPLNIAPRGLVILVEFQDIKFTTSKAEMDSMIMGSNYTREYSYTYRKEEYNIHSKGSARQYFYDSSNGQYNPHFDVVGPVTISHEMSYYGKNNSAGQDSKPEYMIEEACKLADTEYDVDFSQYDNDEDGFVDFVFVIYAGFGEADGAASNTIWPHSWNLFTAAGRKCQPDGKIVDLYACGNELDFHSKMHTGIGTFCHEFSHVLGLPDLYVTNNAGHVTLNEWDIMDYGPYNNDGNTPPAFSAYERFFMGWLTPRLLTEPEEVQLEELNSSNTALMITDNDSSNLIGNDPDPSTFYMIENRQQSGWDEYLPGHGMMLTKIKYSYKNWSENIVNNSSNRMGVDLIEASGKTSKYGEATDLFPAGAKAYTQIADHEIRNIKEKNGVIYFRYRMEEIIEEEEEEEEEEGTEGGDEGKEEEVDGVEDVLVEQQVVAIYNILGQKQMTNTIDHLTTGTYIVKTSSGTYKIVR